MPLSGGAADKYGNRYEGRWTVKCMLDILDGKATGIHLERVGAEGVGFEFELYKGQITEYHQVKRQNSTSGRWLIGELKSNSVLANFLPKLRSPQNVCVFISTHSAHQIKELSDRANKSTSLFEYQQEFLRAKTWVDAFKEICETWSCNEIEAYNYLKRIRIETIGEEALREMLESKVAKVAHGNSENLIDVLAQFALDSVHQKLTLDDIWAHLQSRDFSRIPNSRDKDIEIIKFFRKCFDRSAFKDRFAKEGSSADMREAIEDTILAITTGDYFDRKRRSLHGGLDKEQLVNKEWHDTMEEIVSILEKINRRYQEAIDKGLIFVERRSDGQEVRDTHGNQVGDWIDASRNQVIEKFSKICVEAGIRPLKPLRDDTFPYYW